LKNFFTQFSPALPLTPDPPVSLHDDKKCGTNIKIAFWERSCQKDNSFLTCPQPYPHVYLLWPTFPSLYWEKNPFLCATLSSAAASREPSWPRRCRGPILRLVVTLADAPAMRAVDVSAPSAASLVDPSSSSSSAPTPSLG
jgi:hypothetical protein